MKSPYSRSALLLALGLAVAACARHKTPAPLAAAESPPRFETRSEFGTGTGRPADFDVGDLNGDTQLDIAVISMAGELKILLGFCTDFAPGQSLQIGGTPKWIGGGDFDSDGDRDLVVARDSNHTANVYLNDGLGNFHPGASLAIGEDVLGLLVADFNFDGILDILLAHQSAPAIHVYSGDDHGNFGLWVALDLPGGGLPVSMAVGDVSRDGRPDLVVADPQNSRLVVFVKTGTQFLPVYDLLVAGEPRAVSLGDVSGDGCNDIVVSAFAASKLITITDIDFSGGSGTIAPYTSFDTPLAAAPTRSTIADVTGDGLGDVVACQIASASVVVVPQLAGGGLGEYMQLDASGLPLRPIVGDVDQNGRNDLLVLSGLTDVIDIWFADANGRLEGSYSFDPKLPTASLLGGGDFDNDGDFEVAVGDSTSNALSIMERGPDSRLVLLHQIDVGAAVMRIVTVDLDVDGRLDLLCAVTGGVRVLRNVNRGSGYAFVVMPGFAVTIPTATTPFGLVAADFDRDGDYDIAVSDYDGNCVRLVQGSPASFTFGSETILPLAGGPVDLAAADFTGDGRLDLAVSRLAMSDIVVLRNAGVADFQQALSLPVGRAPNHMITGDWNRDLRADLVVSSLEEGTVTVLFGSAQGFVGKSFPAGAAPSALLAKDLTGDGLDDLLVTSLESGDFRVLVGDGLGGFSEVERFPGTLGASDAVLHDMDGDGQSDLLIASRITHRLSLVRNIRQ